jgi:hypothetical protein
MTPFAPTRAEIEALAATLASARECIDAAYRGDPERHAAEGRRVVDEVAGHLIAAGCPPRDLHGWFDVVLLRAAKRTGRVAVH